jgi:hypothetical protein
MVKFTAGVFSPQPKTHKHLQPAATRIVMADQLAFPSQILVNKWSSKSFTAQLNNLVKLVGQPCSAR